MENKLQLQTISKLTDDVLLDRLSKLLQSSRRVEAELVAHIAEVDERRLWARFASSMFRYAQDKLNLSEHEAYLRIEVARASRRHPVLLEMLADGRIHLSGIAILHKHLNDDNQETFLKRATHKTKKQIEELVAEFAPKPDAPSTIRKLPLRSEKQQSEKVLLGPDRATSSESEKKNPEVEASIAAPPAPPQAPAKPAEVKPLAASRYKVTFTASGELRDKLQRLQALMRSSVPDGDLAAIIEKAVTEKLERLESRRYGKTKTPRKSLEETDTSPLSRSIPAAVKRAVYERDQGQCTHVDPDGCRCTETEQLEFHHREPFARGGDCHLSNIELRCKVHNLYQAELDYGKEVMDKYRRSTDRVSESAAVYTFGNRTTRTRQVKPAVLSAV